ncbi:MAG: hypothetical protein WBP65_10680 [Candidatus Sulfotelmatobacter sp.]|jgi:hypothetical protein
MNRTSRSEKMLQKWLVFSLCVVVPTLAWGQHKPSGGGGAPKAAPKASAPSHPSTASHGATQSHTSTPSHAATGGTHATTGGTHAATGTHTTTGGTHAATGTHTTTGGTHAATGTHTTTGGTHAATGSRPGAAAGHTTTGSRPGTAAGHTTTGGRPGAAGGRPATASRSNVGSRTPPGRNVSLRGGGSASIRPNGSIRSINRNGMQINHGLHGGRTVVSERNGARIVTRGHGGYVQRAYVTRGGHAYYSRTYFAGGRYHVGLYRGYGWGGHMYYGYYPGVWYHPGFYGWGYQPWGVSVAWGIGAWGWGGAPWWGFYGGWWNPYPVYAAPYYWLTDYLIAANLQAAYAARTEANADAMAADAAASAGDGGGDAAQAASSGPVALTPEVKEAIAQEVKAQLAAQQAQAGQDTGGGQASAAPAPTSDQPPPALDPAQRTFVVDTDVTVVANGQECGLTSGDVITRLTDTPDADQTVNASVSATKKGDCASGQTVAVKVDDLQEMYNHFQENITSGMGELAKKQGTGGMPKAPDTGTQAGAVQPPPPDTSVAKTLQDQQQQADQTESQVKQETASGGGN